MGFMFLFIFGVYPSQPEFSEFCVVPWQILIHISYRSCSQTIYIKNNNSSANKSEKS